MNFSLLVLPNLVKQSKKVGKKKPIKGMECIMLQALNEPSHPNENRVGPTILH